MGSTLVPLLKTPPRIRITPPPVVFTGVPFEVEVLLDCRVAVPIDRIVLEVEGTGRYYDPKNEATFAHHVLVSRRVVLMSEEVELAPQLHRFVGELSLPEDAPSSYHGPHLSVRWSVRARVSIPWWPDVERSAAFRVLASPRGPVTPAPPTLFASSVRGPVGRRPYAELSLVSTVVHPGGTVQGRISLANTAYSRYGSIVLSLCQHVDVVGFSDNRTDPEPLSTVHLSPPARDHELVPFALPVPATLVPGFEHRLLSLSWCLRCTIRVSNASNFTLRVDLQVAPHGVVPSDPMHAPSLALVGSERLQAAWARAAADTGFMLEAGALVKRGPRCTLGITLEPRPRVGTMLVADARMQEIDIGLRVDDGRLRCRDPAHSERIAEATDPVTDMHRIESADDRHLRHAVADGGTRSEALVTLARWFESLVTALLDVRGGLSAPASVAHLQPAFERAAAMLGATLVPAGMDVWGQRDEVPFSLESRWDGADDYCSTTLTVRTLVPIDARYHGYYFPEQWPEALPDGLPALLDGATGLAIGPHGIELHMPPLAAGEAAGAEVIDPLVERLEALIAVGRRLSMRGGVYR